MLSYEATTERSTFFNFVGLVHLLIASEALLPQSVV